MTKIVGRRRTDKDEFGALQRTMANAREPQIEDLARLCRALTM